MQEPIKIGIANKYATAVGAPVIVCGNADYSVQFTFDDEWEGLEAKTARFVYVQNGAVKYEDVIFTGDTVQVPMLANVREVMIGVFAGDLCTSTPARIPCELSIRCFVAVPGINSAEAAVGRTTARLANVTLLASEWIGEESPYSQVVTIEGLTANSQVDLTPSVEQLTIFYDKDLAFVTENENGVVTVYAIGQKPTNDYVIQATITEVTR